MLSKAYGLPGLRIGWVACQDDGLIRRIAAFRQHLSVCSAGPSEVLANIALKATGAITGRNRSLADMNLLLLPASVFRSDLVPLPPDRFRIGFGHAGVPASLAAMEAALR